MGFSFLTFRLPSRACILNYLFSINTSDGITKMSASKSPVEVAKGNGAYDDIRVGNNPLPRATDPLGPNPIHCFDKGHHRCNI